MDVHQQLRLDLIRLLLPACGGDIGLVLDAAARAERFVRGNPVDAAPVSALSVPLRPVAVTDYQLGRGEPGYGDTMAGDVNERPAGPRCGEPGYGDTALPGFN